MTNQDDNLNQGVFLGTGRIVEVRREGNIVYARTLRRNEKDTGEGIELRSGEQLVFAPGSIILDLRDIDECYNPKGTGGYRPVANTVWTWYRIAPVRVAFFLFAFSFAQRTDAAYAHWASAIKARDEAKTKCGVTRRLAHFYALAAAEMTIVALGRCYRMVKGLVEKHCPELQIPDSVAKTWETVLEMRNSFEHIDERAEGKIGSGKYDEGALTIFDQSNFSTSAVLRYKGYSLDFEKDVIAALVDCRELIIVAIETRSKQDAEIKKKEESEKSAL